MASVIITGSLTSTLRMYLRASLHVVLNFTCLEKILSHSFKQKWITVKVYKNLQTFKTTHLYNISKQ